MILSLRLFIIGLCLAPLSAYADIAATLSLSPEHPNPYQQTKITLVSYSFDVETAYITWTVNGKPTLAGLGNKTLTITTSGVGEASQIHVKAETKDGNSIDIDMTLVPQGVDIMWESPESYVPPFYEGRSLPGIASFVHVVALPSMSANGIVTDPADVAYSWFVNNQFMESSSGPGKQSANLKLDYLSDTSVIKVLARDPDGNVATKEITITPVPALPLFYRYDDAYGTDYTKNLGLRVETTKNITLSMIPYFFSLNGALGTTASYTWTLDGSPITPTENTRISLQPPQNTYGFRTLSIDLENSKRTFQKTNKTITVVYDTR